MKGSLIIKLSVIVFVVAALMINAFAHAHKIRKNTEKYLDEKISLITHHSSEGLIGYEEKIFQKNI